MSSGYKWKIFGFNIGAYCRSQVSNIGFVEENNLDICYIVIFIRVKFFFYRSTLKGLFENAVDQCFYDKN
jgi:hypothetical protein